MTAGSCPAGWSELEGECYKYFDDWPISWDAAREHCLGEEVKCQEIKDNFYQISISYHQADLASVHSERENQFLAQLSSGQRTWLGGRRSCSGCEDFVWSDGTSLGFTNWWPGEPKTNYEDCIEINFVREGSWNDVPCAWQGGGRFVCKKTKRGQ